MVKTPKVSRAIQTPHKWTVTFGKATKVTTYVLPQCRSEYDTWNEYISGLFMSYLPYYHQCIINSTKPSNFMPQTGKSYTSLIMLHLKTCELLTSPLWGWAPIPVSQDQVGQPVKGQIASPTLKASELPVTNGIEGPVRNLRPSASTSIAAIGGIVEDHTDDQSILPLLR